MNGLIPTTSNSGGGWVQIVDVVETMYGARCQSLWLRRPLTTSVLFVARKPKDQGGKGGSIGENEICFCSRVVPVTGPANRLLRGVAGSLRPSLSKVTSIDRYSKCLQGILLFS